ncbi:RNA ligase family protein [Streptomyces griseiscabiei]|uniref:RNA ligase family protein n=1 Tax=Streptomyces griseiscabiei TaxID=2993540 RepID=A0ABU4LE25_9ACTN|nr:RNA ligase family protein [Streptomyces griseiscabiei]MBZ3907371.1 AAA family ATPase [Streptomyces griseiscabiei]MDX2913464.1 RNA ligase family protein [Streptomyces griseiscabiei]
MRTHYPRTRHLPWSPGATADDLRVADLSGLRGHEVVVTEKLDGENTTLYRDGVHARSLDSAHHPSRTWVKALQARIGHAVPAGWRVCGENMFARHSLAYDDLDSWFYGFSVWDGDGRCLDWDRTVAFLHGLGVPVPRVLWRGVFDERALRALRLDLGRQEGYVVRVVDGFGAEEFGARVAKWVRAGHVRTDTHWMHAAVVENGLGARAPLWAVRSGAPADAEALAEAVGLPGEGDQEAAARFEPAEATGDDRLAGVLAAVLNRQGGGGRRARVAARLAGVVGMPLARRVADLVGLHPALHRPYPDEDRRTGLARLSLAAGLGPLHAVARATAVTDEAREQVEWSALHAEEVAPLDEAALRDAFAGLPPEAALRCRAEAREAYARGRVGDVEGAVAATWRWRSGAFPGLVQLVGPAGSGKSTFARALGGVDTYISLDDLREARGARADQRANADVLRAGLDRLDEALAGGGTTVWDATSLTHQQRSLVHTVAHRRDALITHAVVLVDEDELVRRDTRRRHPVPPGVLTGQLRRFAPPYPGDAHRTWYVGASGTIEDEI